VDTCASLVHRGTHATTLTSLSGTPPCYDKARSNNESRKTEMTEMLADPRIATVTTRRSIAESSGFASMSDLLIFRASALHGDALAVRRLRRPWDVCVYRCSFRLFLLKFSTIRATSRLLPSNLHRLTMSFNNLVDVSGVAAAECHYEWEPGTAGEGTHGTVSFRNAGHCQG
jgi:hypothetical protein